MASHPDLGMGGSSRDRRRWRRASKKHGPLVFFGKSALAPSRVWWSAPDPPTLWGHVRTRGPFGGPVRRIVISPGSALPRSPAGAFVDLLTKEMAALRLDYKQAMFAQLYGYSAVHVAFDAACPPGHVYLIDMKTFAPAPQEVLTSVVNETAPLVEDKSWLPDFVVMRKRPLEFPSIVKLTGIT